MSIEQPRRRFAASSASFRRGCRSSCAWRGLPTPAPRGIRERCRRRRRRRRRPSSRARTGGTTTTPWARAGAWAGGSRRASPSGSRRTARGSARRRRARTARTWYHCRRLDRRRRSRRRPASAWTSASPWARRGSKRRAIHVLPVEHCSLSREQSDLGSIVFLSREVHGFGTPASTELTGARGRGGRPGDLQRPTARVLGECRVHRDGA